MTSLERMLALLKQTHLYDLSDTSSITIELKLYAIIFDSVSAELDALLENCFLEEISPAGYDNYIKLYSLPQEISLKLLKDIVSKRLSITNRDFTINGVKRCLASGGLNATLTENLPQNKVTVKILSDSKIFGSADEKNTFIKSCFPCHVEPIIT